MEFNYKKFKSNLPFLAICVLLIVIFLIISLFTGKSANRLAKQDLEDGDVNISKLVINEIMSSNKGVYADENGKLYDYIEIYNGNNHDINLKDYGLSDEIQQQVRILEGLQ